MTSNPHFNTTPSSRSRSSNRLDDVTSLTSFNPFSEEDEHDQSSYALVSSLISKVKNTLSAPLTSATTAAAAPSAEKVNAAQSPSLIEPRRPSIQYSNSNNSNKSNPDRPNPLNVVQANPAPPLVSLTPVTSEVPSYVDMERTPSQGGSFYAPEVPEGGGYGTYIPGFPIQDSDARSIRTVASTNMKRSDSVSKVIRRIRGEGLSRDYWMDDELCKECYDCKSVFTTWRRKHHCRICGQVYCSRCASNIIKGARFGHDGMIRICNLCLEKLAKVDDSDDDNRSVISSITTSPFAAHQLGSESRSFNLGFHSQSPYAAAQLFPRSDSFSLFSIAETRRPRAGSEGSDFLSRSGTPDFRDEGILPTNHAPFRRAFTEEDKDPITLPETFANDHSPVVPGQKTPIDFPVTVPVSVDGATSSVAFPVSSPDQGYGLESPGGIRSRYNSLADLHGPPFIRSRVQSKLDSFDLGEPGWRTRRESTAYAQELNTISMSHLRVMLRQMLTTENIPNIKEWEETLLKLAHRIARELTFTAHPNRQGADMDVRRYVKIKKIPGGAPRDSEYVDGAVITKNVAHKSMLKMQRNPRVMLVTFPLEFQRVEGQYVHFGQILLQEKDYLGNLASRIAALRPHIVLVEKSVSRIALEALAKRNIAVARAVKPSAISFVARMTQGDVFSSIDKLALEPRLGHCSKFSIQTFDHPLIPGRRKTYMRFEGCNREMGCTIILRGGDIDLLRRVKKVTRFMAFMVRNLKLETHLWKDSVITLPVLTPAATPEPLLCSSEGLVVNHLTSISTQTLSSPPSNLNQGGSNIVEHSTDIEGLSGEESAQRLLSRRINDSLEPYRRTFISVSATLRFPPPYPIRRMKELDDELLHVKQEWEDDLIRREERPMVSHSQEVTVTEAPISAITVPEPVNAEELAAQIESLTIPEIAEMSRTPTPGAIPPEPQDYFDFPHNPITSIILSSSLVSSPGFLPPKEESPIQPKSVKDISLESRLSYVKWQHEEQRRIWEWYLRKNPDDFDVEKYQRISLWEFTLPIAEYGLHRACFPPKLEYITFYGDGDCTLGHFVEKSVREALVKFLDPSAVCLGKGCGQPIARHCRVSVHNETRLFIAVEQWDGQITDRGGYHAHASPDSIITWSACRICGSATPFIPVSEEMQRYSFAKFLELHFYPADVQLVQGAGCQHNIYRHHIRYFANMGMTVRFQADPVTLHEVVYPPMRIRVRPESQLEIKNKDFDRLHNRNNMWYSALIDDLKLINIDAATGEEEADAFLTAHINGLILRADREKNEVTCFINQVYKGSSPTDTLALNQVRAKRQDLIVAWQQDFDRLPKPRLSQSDIWNKNASRTSAFGSVRMWPRRYDFSHTQFVTMSEAEDYGSPSTRGVIGDSMVSASSASEASESESAAKTAKVVRPSVEIENDSKEATAESTAEPKDPDSDSTIGAPAGTAVKHVAPQPDDIIDSDAEHERAGHLLERTVVHASRLPRRALQQPSVAELVKKYQEFLPAQGVEELARTALSPAPPASESEAEGPPPTRYLRPRVKSKVRRPIVTKRTSISDFEQSYAANIAPRYLTNSKRPAIISRIPGPALSSAESHQGSRRTSPDKRPSMLRTNTDSTIRGGRISPPISRPGNTGPFRGRGKPTIRTIPREKVVPSRSASGSCPKSTLKRVPPPGIKVSNIAKHFEKINRDNERASRRYAVIRGRRARPVATARARVEILDSIKDAINDEEESDSSDSSEADDEGDDEEEMTLAKESADSNLEAPSQPHAASADAVDSSTEPSTKPSDKEPEATVFETPQEDKLLEAPTPTEAQPFSPIPPPVPSTPAASPPDSEIGPTNDQRHSILRTLVGLWPQQNQPVRQDGDDPMSDPEHIFRGSSMVVRTDEPTSIIALSLNSPQYRDMLTRSRAEKRQAREAKLTDGGGEAFMPDDISVAESTSTWGVVNVESTDDADPTEELRVPSSKLPWAISFESGGLTISCTVLFAEQFDALRRTYDCEKSMIESLARCVKWDASGGKSGSAFLKTLDDRFIAKELSRAELQAMETFAPAYFDYMSSAVVAHRPTLLAKIFGCYKISFRKTHKDRGNKTRALQMNLMVMENLFYDRRFSKIYDLKGSTRNRHVQSTGRENEVLLDENLVETAHLNPFYFREHSKRIMRGSLFNDSKFLADINVMDYSLVVGVDSQNSELVVGIVADYIRTYTWDKKLESWVKDSAFLGGGANKGEPTIVGPRQYRQRFLSAMERYFPLIPDRWMKQRDAPEEDGNNLLELWPDW
ncbi:hypothetical protein BDY19DRAFT_880871 [Irpex rosettiformis]|uniref:Uncharacterized protein n=1 Tax=Irpex rosettiformis TaxID=378272 RepID=A0ACB8UJG5_9APHY|nr:hypothetical protein BDY19DRAFT_880871 [Irpex rosettiformis]